ncbi:hypothetical protein FDP41_004266 [Naegleria fowleri]|uniref:Uncharacterized protein n=1 Tax=Naegleria fowleri TaxID=5763 RepID=A0A6A5BRQ3_NAEFO|nr:uncharacterized protein FDP41_004266 [Naegleria fowleri]KAF0976971.1 hypothetical protein FDP41_004266 [Naegleria fowleri]CAG4710959.1 unnamed protein product [Naegleria fowleri]
MSSSHHRHHHHDLIHHSDQSKQEQQEQQPPAITEDKHTLRKLRKEQKQQAKKLKKQTIGGKEERKEWFEHRTREKFDKLLLKNSSRSSRESLMMTQTSFTNQRGRMSELESSSQRVHESSCVDPTLYYKETFWQDPWLRR